MIKFSHRQIRPMTNILKPVCILSEMHRSVEYPATYRMHSVWNATNSEIYFLPSDTILTDCQIRVLHCVFI
jgi:hypothetical protein